MNGKEGRQESILQLRNLTQGIGFDPSRVFQLSWHPRSVAMRCDFCHPGHGVIAQREAMHAFDRASLDKIENPVVYRFP